MKAGNFNEHATLQAMTEITTDSGDREEVLVDVADIWIQILPLVGTALYYANQTADETTAKVTLRYRTDVKIGTVFKTVTGSYEVTRMPVDTNYRHFELVADVKMLL